MGICPVSLQDLYTAKKNHPYSLNQSQIRKASSLTQTYHHATLVWEANNLGGQQSAKLPSWKVTSQEWRYVVLIILSQSPQTNKRKKNEIPALVAAKNIDCAQDTVLATTARHPYFLGRLVLAPWARIQDYERTNIKTNRALGLDELMFMAENQKQPWSHG